MFPGSEPDDLTFVSDFPHQIIDQPTVWIPMPDGVRLAARIWRPDVDTPVPAILELIPYRRRDGRLADDEQIHPYFAGHGFACVRVDIRGSGDSEGLLFDEYLRQEQDDAVAIIHWLATQPWCNGNVGMMGLSWGGFNSLQVAVRAPEPLKAIIAVGATVDRYNDDVHYKNGCLLNENFGWGSSFTAFQTRPPDPAIVGKRWRDMWLERLNNLPFFATNWFKHQLRDAYWQHGSVCEDYGAIKAATLIVTGWGDAYVNAVPRLLENLTAPCHAIAGPWAHQYPHLVTPGPAIDFLGEALRWWRHWLLGEETGLRNEPVYRAYCQEGSAPNPYAVSVPGRWVAAKQWPLSTTNHVSRVATRATKVPSDQPLIISSPLDTGVTAGELIPHCLGPEMPQNQQVDDGRSLVFDLPPLEEPLNIWGDVLVTMTLTSNCPVGNLIVRLCDVGPDEASERVTFGTLNLAQRLGNDRAVPMPVGENVTVWVRLDHVAHRFPAGHRVRLALSTACWPLVWPSAQTPRLTLVDKVLLELPMFEMGKTAASASSGQAVSPTTFALPVSPPPANMKQLRPAKNERRVIQDQAKQRSRVEILDDYGRTLFVDNGLVNEGIKREAYEIAWDDPLSATAVIEWTQKVERDNWQTRTETKTTMRCDANYFYLTAHVTAFEGEKLVWEKRWDEKIKRVYV